MSNIIKLKEKEILQRVEEQVKFLSAIYPQLLEDTYQECCIEIRPIRRTRDTNYVKSLNLWKLDEEGIQRLIEFNRNINGMPICTYYSTFAFDYNYKCSDKIKGKINNQNARYTTLLPLDFDDLELSEVVEQLSILENLGLKTTKIFSGNGVQALVLLDKKIYDTKILKKWTTLLLQKGFKVDGSLIDCARVLRMPYTFNCKQFDKNNKKYSQDPIEIETELWELSDERYDIFDVFNKIQTLKDVIPSTKEEIEELKELQSIKKVEFEETTLKPIKERKEKIKEIFEVVKSDIEVVKTQYGHILNIKQIPDAVINMLYKTSEGLRNDTLLFLVPYLINTLKLSDEQVIETIKIWGSRCTTPYTSDFAESEAKRILNYESDYKYGKYTENMRKAFGELEIHTYKKKNTIAIPNDIFDFGGITKISDCSFKIYLYLELNKDKNEYFTIKQISEITNIPIITIKRNMKDLVKYNYVRRETSYKKNKESYKYRISPFRSNATGITIFNKATLKLMLSELNDNEIKLYAYLNRMLNKQMEVTASQKYLGLKIGKAQSNISRITTQLNQKEYLNKHTIKEGILPRCIYELEI